MLTNNLLYRMQSVYLQRKLAGLCLYETNIYSITVSKHVNDHILLASKKIRVSLKIATCSLLKNFAVATRRCDNAMKHLYDI